MNAGTGELRSRSILSGPGSGWRRRYQSANVLAYPHCNVVGLLDVLPSWLVGCTPREKVIEVRAITLDLDPSPMP